MDRFLLTNINVNTLLAKPCFLKLKTDIPLALNLSKTATSFLHPQAKIYFQCS